MSKKACFDTNFLIYCAKQNIDFIDHLRRRGFSKFLIPSSVLSEIKKLSESLRGKEKLAAKLALNIVKDFEVVEVDKKADDALLEICEREGALLFTNDRLLIRRAKKKGVGVGFVREFRRIEL
jgi:hypothetical protein